MGLQFITELMRYIVQKVCIKCQKIVGPKNFKTNFYSIFFNKW